MKFSVPISSLSPRGLKNLFFSFYNKAELLSKATDGNFFVSKDFCYSIGDGVFKEQLLDKIILQQEKAQAKEQGNAQEATQAEQAEQGEHQGAKPLPLSSTFLIRSSKSFSARNFTPIFFSGFL